MSGTPKKSENTLFKKFMKATGIGRFLNRKVEKSSQEWGDTLVASDPVKGILERDFHTNDDVKTALLDLREIGTQDAADGVIKLMNNPSPLGYGYPLANGELVLFAAGCLRKMDNPAYHLGSLLSIEKGWYERRNGARFALEKPRLEDNTHEDEIIAAIEKIGGDEAMMALSNYVWIRYKDKADAAILRLESLDGDKSLDDHRPG